MADLPMSLAAAAGGMKIESTYGSNTSSKAQYSTITHTFSLPKGKSLVSLIISSVVRSGTNGTTVTGSLRTDPSKIKVTSGSFPVIEEYDIVNTGAANPFEIIYVVDNKEEEHSVTIQASSSSTTEGNRILFVSVLKLK